jgi:hypothetical protein
MEDTKNKVNTKPKAKYTKNNDGATVRNDGFVLTSGFAKAPATKLPSYAYSLLMQGIKKFDVITFVKPKPKTTGAFGKCKCCGSEALIANRIKSWYKRASEYVEEHGEVTDQIKNEGIDLLVESGLQRDAAVAHVQFIEDAYNDKSEAKTEEPAV